MFVHFLFTRSRVGERAFVRASCLTIDDDDVNALRPLATEPRVSASDSRQAVFDTATSTSLSCPLSCLELGTNGDVTCRCCYSEQASPYGRDSFRSIQSNEVIDWTLKWTSHSLVRLEGQRPAPLTSMASRRPASFDDTSDRTMSLPSSCPCASQCVCVCVCAAVASHQFIRHRKEKRENLNENQSQKPDLQPMFAIVANSAKLFVRVSGPMMIDEQKT
jgi:hypothetical protein